ncbi:MAG: hypothetical protein ACKO1M_14615, partial [Planctomycetota bacterium]
MLPARRSSLRPPVRLSRGLAWCLAACLVTPGVVGCRPKDEDPELKPEPVLTQPEPVKQPGDPPSTPAAGDSAGPPTPTAAAPFGPPPLEALDR